MKKKRILLIIVSILLLLVIPIPTGVYKDGGTRVFSALTYKIVDWNRMYGESDASGEVLYHDKLSVYPFPMNFMSIDRLWAIEEKNTVELKNAVVDDKDSWNDDQSQGKGKKVSVESIKMTDFSVRLFQASEKEGENILISPLSVMYALAMTANGADGETLKQMEEVLGMTTEDMNDRLSGYAESLPQGDDYKLSLANSIWFREDESFTVNEDFLQVNETYYDSGIYKAPFDDSTVKEINGWVEEKTNKMIPEIIEKIDEDTMMYLINALAFEAEWADQYEEDQVEEGIFTKEDSSEQKVDFMYSEVGTYLEDEYATGFVKYYKECKYGFVALLPKEGVSVSDYISKLDGEHLAQLLAEPYYAGTVITSIPKFETEYSTEMSEVLKAMGMVNAFESTIADLSRLGSGSGNLYINRVLHKTFISVAEKGTKAGAVTAVEVNMESDMIRSEETKEVYLDRPFVYMLIDCENSVPFFIGTLMEVN